MTKGESLITREALPFELAVQHFCFLSKAPKSQLDFIAKWIRDYEKPLKLSLSDCTRLVTEAAQGKERDWLSTKLVLHAYFELEQLRNSVECSGSDLIELVSDAATENDLIKADSEELKKVQDALKIFFENEKKLSQAAKAQKIYEGLIPSFDSCWSLVELRPILNHERTRIEAAIIAATLSLRLREVGTRLGKYSTVSFQLDATDVERLIEELNSIRSKMTLLDHFAASQTDILNSNASLSPQLKEQNV